MKDRTKTLTFILIISVLMSLITTIKSLHSINNLNKVEIKYLKLNYELNILIEQVKNKHCNQKIKQLKDYLLKSKYQGVKK